MTSAVVIPVRNRAGLIGRAVESVLHQTRQLSEIVVVDDGSTDDTPRVVAKLAKTDPRVRLLRLAKSVGAAAARNRGVAETRADWVCFLDSDDTWHQRKHEMQTNAIAASVNAVASFTGLRYAWEGRAFDVPAKGAVPLLDLRGQNIVGSTSSAMVLRQAFDAVKGFDPTLPSCQDWDLWIKLRLIGEFAMVLEPLVDFTQDSNARISKNREAVFEGHEIVFSRALHGIEDRWMEARVRAQHRYRSAQILLEDFDQPGKAARAALRSLFWRPTRHGARLLASAAKRIVTKAGSGMRTALADA
jgi:glycosyltransferase involved in cell wall biosynthesis